MLTTLSIRDIVLIRQLELTLPDGLCALTGETGAGKSILLDSLGLALGGRAESGLVRSGADKGQVAATFEVAADHPARAFLAEQDIDVGTREPLILRRSLSADGRSRAFVNDQPVSVALLRQVGDQLAEIQGQFDQRGLLDPGTHRALLDRYGGLEGDVARVRDAWRTWRNALATREQTEAAMQEAAAQEAELRAQVEELDALDPRPQEENHLSQTRSMLMHAEQVMSAIDAAYRGLVGGDGQPGAEAGVSVAIRELDRVSEKTEGRLIPVLETLDRAAVEVAEAASLLQGLGSEIDMDPQRLEQVEERLFALRACARKHGISPDDLPDLRDRLADKLATVSDGEERLDDLRKIEERCLELYAKLAEALGAARRQAAETLDAAVNAELGPLKLEKARFVTQVEQLHDSEWSASGMDRVTFEVSTNPGATPGALGRIASGGELSRFMLALKVVLSQDSSIATLVFDEVDSGVGGATAAAVGERLARLAESRQILVVTHSPQVAARAACQYQVRKGTDGDGADAPVVTDVEELDSGRRREEIARMISGETITDEARAAAGKLLEVGAPNTEPQAALGL